MLAPLLATLALGGVHDADLNALFADALPRVSAKTRVAVLMPDAMPTEIDPLYPDGFASRKAYFLDLAGVPDCGQATACFEAEISGQKGGTPFGLKAVKLAKGRHGRFKPLTCGGSCSPPSISWKGAGRDLHDPGERRQQAHRAPDPGQDGRRGDQAGTAVARASRAAAVSTASSRPGKRASTSARRSDTWRCVPSARVWVRPASRSTLK